MKRCFIILMVFLLLLTATQPIDAKVKVNKSQENKISQLITVKDGQFYLTSKAQTAIRKLIGQPALTLIKKFLHFYNDFVKKNHFYITKNGTIINKKDKKLRVQGGNVTEIRYYWWGVKNYMSHSKAKSYVKDLKSLKGKLSLTSTLAAYIGGISSSFGGTCGKVLYYILNGLGSGLPSYVGGLKNKVEKVYKKLRKNQGLVVEFKLWLAYDCYKQ